MNNLRLLRYKCKMTQKQLARASGVSQSYINELENGTKTNPSFLILMKLSNAMGVTVCELMENHSFTGPVKCIHLFMD